jgi:hypothetical protein
MLANNKQSDQDQMLHGSPLWRIDLPNVCESRTDYRFASKAWQGAID